jgi:hypothetical protein
MNSKGTKFRNATRGTGFPSEWPPDLIAKRDDLEARIAVKTLEVKHLAKLLDEAIETENANAPDRGKCLPSDRRMWKVGRGGPDGVLRELGGQKLGLKEDARGDEILHIMDERSPYNGLPVWEFKVKVLKAMDLEYDIRIREQARAAKAEGRNPKKVSYPQAPKWDPKTNQFEYKNYSSKTLRKIKEIT